MIRCRPFSIRRPIPPKNPFFFWRKFWADFAYVRSVVGFVLGNRSHFLLVDQPNFANAES